MKIRKLKIENSKKGFSIFIAVIVTGVLLIISFSVSNLSKSEVFFATTNRDSQYALFAADAGVECALYWDSKVEPSAFATSSASTISCSSSSMSGGQAIAGTTTLSRIGGGGNGNPMSVFGFSLNSAQNPVTSCVIVTVNKFYTGSNLTTHIFSRGYNNCTIGDTRRVERGIEVRY